MDNATVRDCAEGANLELLADLDVKHRIVLNVATFSEENPTNVAAKDGPVPDTRGPLDPNVTDNGCGRGYPGLRMDHWSLALEFVDEHFFPRFHH
jgi:hypothetical protein